MNVIIPILLLIIVICFFIGRIDIILMGGAYILLGLSAILVLFFLICLIRLLFMKRREAHFTRIDFVREDSLYQVAFYRVGEREYPCIFPEEGIFRSYFYNPKRTCHVLINERKGRLFDPVSLITIVFGFFAGIAFGTLVLFLFFI